MTAIFVIVAAFFAVCLTMMIRTEMKTMERRQVTPFGASPRKRRI